MSLTDNSLDPVFPGLGWRTLNLLKRHGFHHLLEADRCSDDELRRRGREACPGGPIGPATLQEIRDAAQAFRTSILASDWPAF